MNTAFVTLLKRDLMLAFRNRSEWLNPLLFFIIVVSLFPLAINPLKKNLIDLGPGVIWVAALLATLLSLDHLFRSDYDDGSLEQLLTSPNPLTVLVYAKILAQWLMTGLPLLLISPILGLLLNLTPHAIGVLMLSLLLGTPTMSLIGAIGVALTVGLRQTGILLSLLVLPLYIPVLIFGASSVVAANQGFPANAQLALLGALLTLALALAPIATAAALRVGITVE